MEEPPRGATTIRMMAELLGVSPSTVSRALHPEQSRRIGEGTVRRVRAAAAELGYEPNPWARSLRTKRTYTLGLIIPWLSDGVLAVMLEAAEDRAREAGYMALTLSTRDREGEQQRLTDILLERRVDGLILATAPRHDPSLARLAERDVPFVLVNRASGQHPVVRGDDELGGYLATRHLLSLGHRHIGFIAGRSEVSTAALRLRGYRRAHSELGLRVEQLLVVPSSFSADGGYIAAGRLLGRSSRPSAVFAVNDAVAIGTMAAARDLGLHVPDEVAVVGYNNSELAPMLQVPLTSVGLPLQQFGSLAVEMLLKAMAGEHPRSILLPPRLVVRASSGRARTSEDIDASPTDVGQSIAQ